MPDENAEAYKPPAPKIESSDELSLAQDESAKKQMELIVDVPNTINPPTGNILDKIDSTKPAGSIKAIADTQSAERAQESSDALKKIKKEAAKYGLHEVSEAATATATLEAFRKSVKATNGDTYDNLSQEQLDTLENLAAQEQGKRINEQQPEKPQYSLAQLKNIARTAFIREVADAPNAIIAYDHYVRFTLTDKDKEKLDPEEFKALKLLAEEAQNAAQMPAEKAIAGEPQKSETAA